MASQNISVAAGSNVVLTGGVEPVPPIFYPQHNPLPQNLQAVDGEVVITSGSDNATYVSNVARSTNLSQNVVNSADAPAATTTTN